MDVKVPLLPSVVPFDVVVLGPGVLRNDVALVAQFAPLVDVRVMLLIRIVLLHVALLVVLLKGLVLNTRFVSLVDVGVAVPVVLLTVVMLTVVVLLPVLLLIEVMVDALRA